MLPLNLIGDSVMILKGKDLEHLFVRPLISIILFLTNTLFRHSCSIVLIAGFLTFRKLIFENMSKGGKGVVICFSSISISLPFPHPLTHKRYPQDVTSSRSVNTEPVSKVLKTSGILTVPFKKSILENFYFKGR